MVDADGSFLADDGPDMGEWRKLATRALKGGDLQRLVTETRDGIAVEPLYPPSKDAGGQPAGRDGRWTIVQPVDDPDPERANQQALADLAGGATGLSLRFADTEDAGLPATATALREVLADIDLAGVHVRLAPHAEGPETALQLKAQIAETGLAAERANVAFGLDPIAVWATIGTDAVLDAENHAACFVALRHARFTGPLALASGHVYHNAGASEAQELAAVLASAVWWLRLLEEAGVEPEACLPLIGASLATDRDMFLSIAKLRAMRLLWARLQELCGAPGTPLHLHVETSSAMLTRTDPDGNLLRNALAAFAAVTGGADTLCVQPHMAALGPADGNARALARNIQHLLLDEAQLHRVGDPGGGSGLIDALTDALAQHGWQEFQGLEREGGIVASLRSGAFLDRIAAAREALGKAVAAGRMPLVGSTIYRPDGAAAEPVAALVSHRARLRPVRLEELARQAI